LSLRKGASKSELRLFLGVPYDEAKMKLLMKIKASFRPDLGDKINIFYLDDEKMAGNIVKLL